MIGEFGTDWHGWNYNNSDPYLRGYREGIWSGALGGSSGHLNVLVVGQPSRLLKSIRR